MRGKQVVLESLIAHGVAHVFGNPGTTESPLLDGLLDYPALSYVLCLHEGVALGAATYHALAAGRPSVVSLHVAPGLGNALGMLYSAARAGAPVVVTAGQQDTRLRLREPVLGHDLVAMAAPLVKWSAQAERVDELGLLLRRAFKVATDPPAGPVFLALPIDVLEQETDQAVIGPGALFRTAAPDPVAVAQVAGLLLAARRPAIVVGDDVARAGAHDALLTLAERLGASVWHEGLHLLRAVPSAHPCCRPGLPFDATGIRTALDGHDLVLLVGGRFFEEVWFAPGSPFPPGATVIQVEEATARLAQTFAPRVGLVGNLASTLVAVGDAVRAGADARFEEAAARRREALDGLRREEAEAQRARATRRWDRSPLSLPRVAAELAAVLPPDAIVVDESITASLDLGRTLEFRRPGDYWGARGGGIGQGLPGALGVKLAHPDRPVVCVSGDGSAMYSIQALWTAAHHGLAVVFVILDNREYRILKHNMDTYRQRFGARAEGPYLHMDLGEPTLSFVDLARGLGVAGTRVTRPEELRGALEDALLANRPRLVDVAVEGRG